jgi:SAM-dependent methyltransferase
LITNCRSCGGTNLSVVLDLGSQPIANALLNREDEPEAKYPLAVAFCSTCAMLQVTETVSKDVLYCRDYPYFSSCSSPVLIHAEKHVEALIRRYDLGSHSLVIEVASNDGYLLRNFVKRGIPCLGIDPAGGPVGTARSIGVPTIYDFFGSQCAERLAGSGRLADVVIANNVLAHVDDINDFVAGVARILKPTGVAVFEFAYAVDMIERYEFDTIYHEHVFYHTLHGLAPLFRRHGLYLNDAEHFPIHGGSLRLTVSRKPWPSKSLLALQEREIALGVGEFSFYADFAAGTSLLLSELIDLLKTEKAEGKRIACYGAAAKGATLLNCLNMGESFFEFVVDSTPYKQGKFIPGQRIPIVHPDRLLAEQPDDVLLLAWNFADEIIQKEAVYRQRGGNFIVPIPIPRIVLPDQKRSAA